MQFLFLFIIIFLGCICSAKSYTIDDFPIYPICTKTGKLICPDNFIADCAEEKSNGTPEARCFFYENMFLPGCWKQIGIKKLDLSLIPKDFKSTMIEIVGGGEVYTFNRETIGCRKP